MEQSIELTKQMVTLINEKSGDSFFMAISGGSSPLTLFELWKGGFRNIIDWNKIKLFWVDERVVPPDSDQSNYGVANNFLLKNIPIPNDNIYRIFGENNPDNEAKRYSSLVNSMMPQNSGFPIFDLIILGVGEDGHTASIFPGQNYLLSFSQPYAASVNPYNGQQRVTMTGGTILNSAKTFFYLNGASKKSIVESIVNSTESEKSPASFFYINLKSPALFWDSN